MKEHGATQPKMCSVPDAVNYFPQTKKFQPAHKVNPGFPPLHDRLFALSSVKIKEESGLVGA